MAAVGSMTGKRPETLRGQVHRGLAWSTLSNVTLRAASFVLGIVLARLLAPEQFGMYAVALTVQAILMTLADLGLSAELIRSNDPDRRAPAVGLIGLCTGSFLAVLMAASSTLTARMLGAPGAAAVIAVLSLTLLLGGAGVVPYALLQRRFDQRRLFMIAAVDFTLSTALTVALIESGAGVMSLAVGRVAGQTSTLLLQFWMSGTRPRFKTDRATLATTLRFCLPVGGANLLSWLLLNLDNIVIARAVGPVALGFYVLAFNISSWPMNVLGQIVRSVSMPTFARLRRAGRDDPRDPSLGAALAYVWAVALPVGALLALLAMPLVLVVYGHRWHDSAPVLVALAVFGALRMVFDLFASYLLARGAAAATLFVQIVWCVTLLPVLWAMTHTFGIVGAGWGHVIVAAGIVLPAYVVVLGRAGAKLGSIVTAAVRPVTGTLLLAGAVAAVGAVTPGPWPHLVLGGATGGAVYLAVVGHWLLRAVPPARDNGGNGRASGLDEVVPA